MCPRILFKSQFRDISTQSDMSEMVVFTKTIRRPLHSYVGSRRSDASRENGDMLNLKVGTIGSGDNAVKTISGFRIRISFVFELTIKTKFHDASPAFWDKYAAHNMDVRKCLDTDFLSELKSDAEGAWDLELTPGIDVQHRFLSNAVDVIDALLEEGDRLGLDHVGGKLWTAGASCFTDTVHRVVGEPFLFAFVRHVIFLTNDVVCANGTDYGHEYPTNADEPDSYAECKHYWNAREDLFSNQIPTECRKRDLLETANRCRDPPSSESPRGRLLYKESFERVMDCGRILQDKFSNAKEHMYYERETSDIISDYKQKMQKESMLFYHMTLAQKMQAIRASMNIPTSFLFAKAYEEAKGEPCADDNFFEIYGDWSSNSLNLKPRVQFLNLGSFYVNQWYEDLTPNSGDINFAQMGSSSGKGGRGGKKRGNITSKANTAPDEIFNCASLDMGSFNPVIGPWNLQTPSFSQKQQGFAFKFPIHIELGALEPNTVIFKPIGAGRCRDVAGQEFDLIKFDITNEYTCEEKCANSGNSNLVGYNILSVGGSYTECECLFTDGYITSSSGGNCPGDAVTCVESNPGDGAVTQSMPAVNYDCYKNDNFVVSPGITFDSKFVSSLCNLTV